MTRNLSISSISAQIVSFLNLLPYPKPSCTKHIVNNPNNSINIQKVEVQFQDNRYISHIIKSQKFLKHISCTIHKKEVCLRQKSPETWKCLPNPTFFTDFKSFGFSLENSATSKWMPFFIFFKNFILDFFLFIFHISNCRNFRQ